MIYLKVIILAYLFVVGWMGSFDALVKTRIEKHGRATTEERNSLLFAALFWPVMVPIGMFSKFVKWL